MHEVFERVWVANEQGCRSGNDGWAVVHACKSPCHQQVIGYLGNLSNSHPNYLFLIRGSDLYLNLIDPPKPLFMSGSFNAFLDFADTEWTAGRKLLIHCNQGESRAPSLALLFMAKRRAALDDSSYFTARSEFEKIYKSYRPGMGIQTYLSDRWRELGVSAPSI